MALQLTRKIVILAFILIAYGVVEILVGLYFTHEYFVQGAYIYLISALDVLYFVSGALLLTMRKQTAKVVVGLLACEMVGRLTLIGTGIYPFTTVGPGIAMVLGTAIAGGFAFYVWTQWDKFN